MNSAKIIWLMLCSILGSLSLTAQQFEWARGWGSKSPAPNLNADDVGYDVTTDMWGNVYTTGAFTFATDFDPGPGVRILNPLGSGDAFISKLDAAGNFIWAQRMGGSFTDYRIGGRDEGRAVTTDEAGNIYVAGIFSETADFGSFTLTAQGATDAFICKLDGAGNFIWVKQLGDSGYDGAYCVVADDYNHLYITGSIGPVATGGGFFGQNGSNFTAKFDTAGNLLWTKATGGNDLALDGKGYIYLTGAFYDTTDFDPGPGVYNLAPIPHPGGYTVIDMFISKLDTGGNFIWVKAIANQTVFGINGTYDEVFGESISVDPAGYIYATGSFCGTIDFDPGPASFNITSNNPGSPPQDLFIAKYSIDGSFVWANAVKAKRDKSVLGNSIDLDESGNAYVTGFFDGSVDFDPGAASFNLTASQGDVFIMKLTSDGSFAGAQQITGPGEDQAEAIHIDACGNIYTTGSFGLTPDFDPGPGTFNLSTVSGTDRVDEDVFVLKLSQSIKPHITVDTFVLGVSASYSTYQWYLNGIQIPGATDSIYIVLSNGNYTVVVTGKGGCVDTTDLYKVNNADSKTDVTAISNSSSQIYIYPNPAKDIVHVKAPTVVDMTVTSADGKIIFQQENTNRISVGGLMSGIYLLYITKNGNLLKVEKLVIQ